MAGGSMGKGESMGKAIHAAAGGRTEDLPSGRLSVRVSPHVQARLTEVAEALGLDVTGVLSLMIHEQLPKYTAYAAKLTKSADVAWKLWDARLTGVISDEEFRSVALMAGSNDGVGGIQESDIPTRLAASRLFSEGHDPKEVAEVLGVEARIVQRWHKEDSQSNEDRNSLVRAFRDVYNRAEKALRSSKKGAK